MDYFAMNNRLLLALERIRDIVSSCMEDYIQHRDNPECPSALDNWVSASLSSQDMIEIFEILEGVNKMNIKHGEDDV